MIYTCTFNPSIDYILTLDSDDFAIGRLNRSKEEVFHPGGKGINVSILLSNLGVQNTLFGFVAGFTGRYLVEELERKPYMSLNFLEVDGLTRINVKLKANVETEINAHGPTITPADYQRMLQQFERVNRDDIVILSGSVPKGCETIYEDVSGILNSKGIPFIVDANKASLHSTLKHRPFLIKPNIHELEGLFQTSILTTEEVIIYGKKTRELGAQNVLISLGHEGSIFISDEGIFRASVPEGTLVNSVGAGDSMVAGFVYKYQQTHQLQLAYRYAAACGTATAYSIGIAQKEMIETLYEQIRIERIEA